MAQAAKRGRVPRRAGAAARWRAALAELRTLPAAQVADALSGWACVDDYVVSDVNLIRSRDHKDVPLIRKDKGRRVFSPAFLFVRLIRARQCPDGLSTLQYVFDTSPSRIAWTD